MTIHFVDFIGIYPIFDNILNNLSVKNKLRLAFTNKVCTATVLNNLSKLNIVSVPHCYVAHAHEAIIHKMYHEAREKQVQHYIEITQSFSKFSDRYLRNFEMDSQYKHMLRHYCEQVHMPCPPVMSNAFIYDVLDDVENYSDRHGILHAKTLVELWYPKPDIELD